MPPSQHRRSLLDRIGLLFFTIATLLSYQARAGQNPELVLADGTRPPAALSKFDYNAQATTWRFVDSVGGLLESNAANPIVRWGTPAQAQLAATLVLRDGSILITDRTWAASGYARVDEKSVGLNRRDGWAMVDRSEAEWLLLEAAAEGTRKEELLPSISGKQSKNDRVWLVGGDQISGEVLRLGYDTVSIRLGKDDTPIEVPVSRVRAIRFAFKQGNNQQKPTCLVGLDNGSLLVASSVQITAPKANIETLSGLSLEIEAETIVFLQPSGDHLQASSGQKSLKNPTASRRVVKYLSDGEADDYRSTPYFDLAWPYARDVSLDGTPLQAGGRRYAKGLAVHSAARLVYRLDTQANEEPLRFQTELAIADSDSSLGSVVFRVYTIRDGQVEPVYKSPIVRSDDAPLPIDLDLSGATALVLVVDYADNGDTGDQALWLDARLIGN